MRERIRVKRDKPGKRDKAKEIRSMGVSPMQRRASRPVKCGHGRDARATGNETLKRKGRIRGTRTLNSQVERGETPNK